jgi:hypothetical protein
MRTNLRAIAVISAIMLATISVANTAQASERRCLSQNASVAIKSLGDLPPGMTNWNMKDDGKSLTLTGQVSSLATVASLMRMLDTSSQFEKPVLVSVVRGAPEGDRMDFNISVATKCLAP